MSRSADPDARPIDGGEACPKCGKPMQRYEHSPDWRPQLGRGFFRYWDRCRACNHQQNYQSAKVRA